MIAVKVHSLRCHHDASNRIKIRPKTRCHAIPAFKFIVEHAIEGNLEGIVVELFADDPISWLGARDVAARSIKAMRVKMPFFSAVSDSVPLQYCMALRISLLKPSISYSVDNHGIWNDGSCNAAIGLTATPVSEKYDHYQSQARAGKRFFLWGITTSP